MASSIATKTLSVEIRKLRKNLRQIDNLKRLDRPLLEEEEEKVLRTSSIRSLLRKKLKELAAIEEQFVETEPNIIETEEEGETVQELDNCDEAEEQNEEIIYDININDSDEMKRPLEEEEETEANAGGDTLLESRGGQDEGDTRDERTPPKIQRREKDPGEVAGQGTASTSNQGKTQEAKVKTKNKAKQEKADNSDLGDGWAGSKFMVQDLEGHNDIICAVSCSGTRLLTGSRDTMVKYWDLDKGTELRSLGGHSGTVTSVMLLSSEASTDLVSHNDLSAKDHIAVTGSKDCTIKIWSLETGQLLHSIYTYNPVECLGYITERALVVSGSDGGKVELWDAKSRSNVFSTIGHEDAVTCIQISNTNVYTTSSDGIIKLWQLRGNSLHPTFVSENISSKSSTHLLARRHIRSLAISGETIYYGDDGLNVKALEWKRGLVHKLKNHTGDFGSTDSMCSTKDLLICAGYDLDNGCGYLNFWSLPEEVYLTTLGDQDTSRIVAMDCTQTKDGALRIITGGQELRMWDRIPKKRYSPQDSVPTEYNRSFAVKAHDSDIDSDTAEMSDSDGGQPGERQGRRWSQGSGSTKSSWSSWCTVV